MNPEQPTSGRMSIILGILVVLTLACGIGYYFSADSNMITSESLPAPSLSPSPLGQSIDTTTWKSYSDSKSGFSFKYPAHWDKFTFTQQDETVAGSGGSLYASYDRKNIAAASTDLIFMTAYTKNYSPLPGIHAFPKAINLEWNLEQYNKASPQSKALLVRKLSNKSLLVVEYVKINCAPALEVNVYSPFIDNYPTLQIAVPNSYTHITGDNKFQGDPCNYIPYYQSFVSDWNKNGFPPDLKDSIKIAQAIADSVQLK
jgi:hypothetical protein